MNKTTIPQKERYAILQKIYKKMNQKYKTLVKKEEDGYSENLLNTIKKL